MAENALANQTANKSKQDAVPAKDKTDFRNLDSKQKPRLWWYLSEQTGPPRFINI